jgi:signal transduction histidine kinase
VVVDQSEERRRERQFQALLRVQQILAASPSLDAGGPAGLQTLAELVPCQRAELWVRRPADGPWRLAAEWRQRADDVCEAVPQRPTATATDHVEFLEAVRQRRQVLYRGEADTASGATPLVAGRGEAACGVPVMDQQQVIAVLGLYGPDLEEFDEDLRRCVQSVAYAIGQFLMRQQGAMELAETRSMLRQAQKMDALGLLTGGIAHDFNNVLTVILSYSEIAGDEIGTAHPAHEMLTEIHHAGQRAAAMTRRLLSFSRRHDEQPVLICVNELVTDLERMLRRLIGPSIVLESRLAPGAGPVHADPGQLEQVLVNLIVNARDAMPSGGSITVSTCGVTLHSADLRRYPDSRSGDYVAISVADTGCGMDESTKARIFEPFFTTKDPGRGTGMGLATVAAIVRQCGGFIDVETAAGRGTLMHVFLPRARVTFATQVVDEKSSPPPGGTETILLVEEDPTIRTLMRRIVQVRGYHVLEADEGEEALRVLAEATRPVSLVLTSPEAVRMGSGEFARRLRAVSPGAQMMLLVDVADDSNTTASEDVVDVLQKPFTSDDLARKIRVVLDERAG